MMRCDGCGTRLEGGLAAFCPYCGMRQDSPGEAGYVPEILDGGFAALRMGDFCGALRYFERVARVEPENGRALLGKLMAVGEAHTVSELAEIIRGNTQRDNEIFTLLLRKAVEIALGEMREVFSDDYYDAKALMRAGKYNEALRILRAIEDYHSDAPDMAGECLRHLADDIVRKLKPSMTHESRNLEIDPEIDALREECRVMIERYIEAMYTRSQSTPAEEYIFAMNASQLVKCVDRLNAEGKLTGLKRLRLLNDTRAILRKTGEFLERNAPAAQGEAIQAVNDSIITTQGEPLPAINERATTQYDSIHTVNDNDTMQDDLISALNDDSTDTIQDASITAINDSNATIQDDSLPAVNDSHAPTQDDLFQTVNKLTYTTQNASLPDINDNNTAKQDASIPAINDSTATIQDDSLPAVNDSHAPMQNDATQTMNDGNAMQDYALPTTNDYTATATQNDNAPIQDEPIPAVNDNAATTQDDSHLDTNDSHAPTHESFININASPATIHEPIQTVNNNTPIQNDSLTAINESTTTQNDSFPAINNSITATQDDSLPSTNDSTTTDDALQTMTEYTYTTQDSLPTPNDSKPDTLKIPGWLKIALITAALIVLALTLPQILSLIASLL